MNLPALTNMLRSLQSVIYVQTHDVLQWMVAIQGLVTPRRDAPPILFFLKPGVERDPKGWAPPPESRQDIPGVPPSTPTFSVEFTEEQILSGLKSVRAFDGRDTAPYFVLPNVVLTPAMVAEFRLLRLQQEMDDRNVKGVIVLSHEPPPADLRPFCQYIEDSGPTEEEATKYLKEMLQFLRREKVPAEPLAKAAEGYSLFQIREGLTRAVVETRRADPEILEAQLTEAFAKTMAKTPKAYEPKF